MAMTTFPFLNVHPSISDRILERLDFGELFNLAQCSKRTFNMLKNSGYRTPTYLHANIYSSPCFYMHSPSHQNISWVFYHNRDPRKMDLENPRTHRIPGCKPMDFCVKRLGPLSIVFDCVSEHSAQEILKFAEYLLALFHCSQIFLKIHYDLKNYLDGLLAIEDFRRCQKLEIFFKTVTHTELRRILTGFTTEDLTLECDTHANFSFDGTLKYNAFAAYKASWVNAQILRNLDCKTGSIHRSTLTNEDINKYITTWLEGSNTKLEHITISPSKEVKIPLDLSKIMEGIPSTPGVAKRQNATTFRSFGGYVPYEIGMDLKRTSDGMRGTALIFHEPGLGDVFVFVVWHVPNPDLVVG